MTSQIYNQKKFIPTAPEKGSFPLDHESLCKKQFLLYASCLRRSENDNAKCREQAQDYLGAPTTIPAMKPERNVLIAATGSVATIRIPQLIAQLSNEELPYKFNLKIIITENTKHFFELELIPECVPVLHNRDEWITWNKRGDPVLHIELGKWADLLLIAPLSANTLAKIATGICDNLVTCVVRAWDLEKPLLFAPAMNTRMYDHPLTREQIDKIVSWGYTEIPCICKTLMCGDTGNGAMAEVPALLAAVVTAFKLAT